MPDWTRGDNGNRSSSRGMQAFCAVELALLDWSLRADYCALADLLPPARFEVVYKRCLISADEPKDAAALAKRMTRLGIRQIKVKVGTTDDAHDSKPCEKRSATKSNSARDANGAWRAGEAVEHYSDWRNSNCR